MKQNAMSSTNKALGFTSDHVTTADNLYQTLLGFTNGTKSYLFDASTNNNTFIRYIFRPNNPLTDYWLLGSNQSQDC